MGTSTDISDEGGGVRGPTHNPKNEDIILGATWRHRRQGYAVTVRCAVQMKDDNDAHWRDAVGYTINGRDGETHVRSEVDFLIKFEEIK